MDTEMLVGLAQNFHDYCARFADLFGRKETRETFAGILAAMMTPGPRKNGWQLAQGAGDATPDVVHQFLTRAQWDADALRDRYMDLILERLGSQGALLFDETGFLKQGDHSVAVQRQYTGTAGKITNCQIAVFAAWVTPRAHVLIDRRLFVPDSWLRDEPRRQRAHIPDDLTHRTKGELAREILTHVLQQGATPRWVGGDAVYGDDEALRAAIAAAGLDYALAVSCTAQVWEKWPEVESAAVVNASKQVRGQRRRHDRVAPGQPSRVRVDALAAGWEAERWQELSCGEGSKGERAYLWGWQRVVEAHNGLPSREVLLLVRQALEDETDRAYFLCHGDPSLSVQQWVERVGTRWAIEQCFEEAKAQCGLDEYEVRRWESWHRHVTLSMVAHGFLALQRVWSEDWLEKKKRGGRGARGGASVGQQHAGA